LTGAEGGLGAIADVEFGEDVSTDIPQRRLLKHEKVVDIAGSGAYYRRSDSKIREECHLADT
jgi:hypothetical protein